MEVDFSIIFTLLMLKQVIQSSSSLVSNLSCSLRIARTSPPSTNYETNDSQRSNPEKIIPNTVILVHYKAQKPQPFDTHTLGAYNVGHGVT
jgi:hypothetical protein